MEQPIDSPQPRRLVLASTSIYRRELLGRLRLPFQVEPPGVDESPQSHEPPLALARRLAAAKAHAVALRHPACVVLGSDQVADLDGEALGKPGNFARAREQLRSMSGRTVLFHTALTVVCSGLQFDMSELATVRARFRALRDAEIESYLNAEQPWDCAGSAKSEGLGIALLESIESDDPTALIGLPLIRCCVLLRAAGFAIP